MQIHKKKIKKEDGRYLIYYTFTDTEEEKERTDVRVEMESKNPQKIIALSVLQKREAYLRKYRLKILILWFLKINFPLCKKGYQK